MTYISTTGKTCSTPDCGQPAVAWYDYGNGEQYACVTHNPFRNVTINPPPSGGDLCPTCHQPWTGQVWATCTCPSQAVLPDHTYSCHLVKGHDGPHSWEYPNIEPGPDREQRS